MATLHLHRPTPRAGVARETAGVLALALAGCVVLFFALGTIDGSDVVGVVEVLVVACAAWVGGERAATRRQHGRAGE